MKTVILAGGHGRRFQYEQSYLPKPLVEIASKPLLCHVMEVFASQGFTEFFVALGYGAAAVKEYFLHFRERHNDLTVRLATGESSVHAQVAPPWTIHLIDTGAETASGGRLRRMRDWLKTEERFFVAYCDGLANIDLAALLEFHRSRGKLVTMTAVHPPGRFGLVGWDGDSVAEFREKPPSVQDWINGGFFVVERTVLDLIEQDNVSWERHVLPKLAEQGELAGFRHEGFFAAVDTPKDREAMQELCASGAAPWSGS